MFLTKKKIELNEIIIEGIGVEVVDDFKLLGVVIDKELTLQSHIKALKRTVNMKLFSMKKLKFLSKSVKILFFKAFLLPHFDYSSSIMILMNKTLIKNYENFFNLCVWRFLNINILNLDPLEQKIELEKYNILPIKLRIFIKLNLFCYKIMNNLILSDFCSAIVLKETPYYRESRYRVPIINSNYEKSTFIYFLPKFVNAVIKNAFNLPLKEFKQFLTNNLLTNFQSFTFTFANFSNNL